MRIAYEGGVKEFLNSMSIVLAEDSLSENVRRLAELAIVGYPQEYYPKGIFYFVKTEFQYAQDPVDAELLQRPNLVATDYFNGIRRAMDCDCQATLISAMLRSIGIEARIAIIDSNMDGEWSHAIAQVKSDIFNEYVNLDTTTPTLPLGWFQPYTKITYVVAHQ